MDRRYYFTCSCGRKFSRQNALLRHEKIHCVLESRHPYRRASFSQSIETDCDRQGIRSISEKEVFKPPTVDEMNAIYTWTPQRAAITDPNAGTMDPPCRRINQICTAARQHLSQYLQFKVQENIRPSSHRNELLHTLNEAWNDHWTYIGEIRRTMTQQRNTAEEASIRKAFDHLGLITFRNEVLGDDYIRNILRGTLLGMVARERTGEVIDRVAMKNACQMLMTLSKNRRRVYEKIFERPFLIRSAAFYRMESHKFLSENSPSVYMQKVKACIAEESDRAKNCFDESTEPKIVRMLEQVLIERHRTLIEMSKSNVVQMENDCTEELGNMYKSLSIE